jgi:DNA-binding PadR family transcriptional regulator
MSPPLRLRESSYAVLLLIALRGPSSPYDLKRALHGLSQEFWAVPHTQVYAETERLARDGLLSVRRDADGRRRQTYRLTRRGRSVLEAWLADADASGMQIRDEAQLKLLGSELSEAASIAGLARRQADHYRQRLARLEAVAAAAAGDTERAMRYLAVPLGLAVYRAALDFWEAIAAAPPGAVRGGG